MTDLDKSSPLNAKKNTGDEDDSYKPQFDHLPHINQANDYSSGSYAVVTTTRPGRSQTHAQVQQSQFSSPRDNNFFCNLAYGLVSALGGSAATYPLLRAFAMISLHPDMPIFERIPKYIVDLPKVIVEKGPKSLFQYYTTYASMVPALAIDLAFFYSLKSIIYPRRYFLETDIPLFSNVLLASSVSFLRYTLHQPLSETYSRVKSSSAQMKLKDLVLEMQSNMKNRIQANGIGGLYEGIIKNLPALMIFRGLQLGITETIIERTKYKKGETLWIQKFIISYFATTIAKFIAYPLDATRAQIGGDEKHPGKNIKKYFDTMFSLFNQEGTRVFKRAFSSAFHVSGSALALSIFFHLNDSKSQASKK